MSKRPVYESFLIEELRKLFDYDNQKVDEVLIKDKLVPGELDRTVRDMWLKEYTHLLEAS